MATNRRLSYIGLTAFATLILLFLYVPVATLIVLSFNNSNSMSLPWVGFTTRWYSEALANSGAFVAFLNSAKLGICVGVLSTLIGLLTALAFRRAIIGKPAILGALLIPLLVPGIVLAVSQAVTWNIAGWVMDLWSSTLIGHLVYTVPFAFLTIFPRVHRFDRNIEAAAMDLGAPPLVAFWTIVVPQIAPGLVASFLFCFTLSFDEFVRTLFLIGPQNTLPIYLWSIILNNPSPQTSAITILSMAFSLVTVGVGSLLLRQSQRIRGVERGYAP
jgi:ABC-type spermidine/putrescine transport system permease subunit II